MRFLLRWLSQEPLPEAPEDIGEYVISSEAMAAQDEVCDAVRGWLEEAGLVHARSRGSEHKAGVARIDRQDIEYGGQHLRALMQLASPTDPKPEE